MAQTSFVFGLFGEGPTERDFLLPLLRRTFVELLPGMDIYSEAVLPERGADTFLDQVVSVARQAYGYHLLICHLDADAPSPDSIRARKFDPSVKAVEDARRQGAALIDVIIPVIPVRMTEAWVLADFEAFRAAVGTKQSLDEARFSQKPDKVERIEHPKQIFEAALRNSRPRRSPLPREVFPRLAEEINLDRLRVVPAYRQFLHEARNVLRSLHFLTQ
ncbi:MAG: DUF4276 family protein [Anaerolineae bacterium]|nr:DUF4276 family protein [Anaerolineae bacterium]NUQ05141.1 DUF4276 family protein [Anaerolineae bacterium]